MIEIRGLCFAYGGREIFRNFSAEIGEGVTVLTGASGRGKTTLLRLISGFTRPDAGTITGVPGRIGYLFQEDRLLPWLTAEENVAAVLPRERAAEAGRRLRDVELDGFSARRPGELSGGQRRRVALARALAFGGELLMLDEPLKGLDDALAARIVPMVLAQGVPVLVTSNSAHETELWGGTELRLG